MAPGGHVGHWWPLMAPGGHWWPLMAPGGHVGHWWPLMAPGGHVGPPTPPRPSRRSGPAHPGSCCVRRRPWRWRRPRRATRRSGSSPPTCLQGKRSAGGLEEAAAAPAGTSGRPRTSRLAVAEVSGRGRRAAGGKVARLADGRRLGEELVQRHGLQNHWRRRNISGQRLRNVCS